jgi:hypothetical protein
MYIDSTAYVSWTRLLVGSSYIFAWIRGPSSRDLRIQSKSQIQTGTMHHALHCVLSQLTWQKNKAGQTCFIMYHHKNMFKCNIREKRVTFHSDTLNSDRHPYRNPWSEQRKMNTKKSAVNLEFSKCDNSCHSKSPPEERMVEACWSN